MKTPPIYPKGDLRRMLLILAVLHQSESGVTLVNLANRTGLSKKTVTDLIASAGEQAAVEIEKIGPVYHLKNIGPVFKIDGAKKALQGALNAPTIEPSEQ